MIRRKFKTNPAFGLHKSIDFDGFARLSREQDRELKSIALRLRGMVRTQKDTGITDERIEEVRAELAAKWKEFLP